MTVASPRTARSEPPPGALLRRLVAVPLGDWLVVPRGTDARTYLLNPLARWLWESLAAGEPLPALVDEIAAATGRPTAEVATDAAGLLARWRAEGLLDPAGPPAAIDQAARDARLAALDEPGRVPLATEAFQVGERPVAVRFHDAETRALVQAAAGPAARGPADPARAGLAVIGDATGLIVAESGRVVATAANPMAARWHVLRRIVGHGRAALADVSILHAAAVGDGRRAVVLCGSNGAGKTTLTAQLLHAGLELVSDDILPLDPGAGAVWPVPFALSVKQGSWEIVGALFPSLWRAPVHLVRGLEVRFHLPDAVRLADPARPLPVAALVFPRFAPGAAPALHRLDPVEALQAVAASWSRIPAEPSRLTAFLRWLEAVPALALDHGGGEAALAIVRDLLTSPIDRGAAGR
jgi:hypothetical protein